MYPPRCVLWPCGAIHGDKSCAQGTIALLAQRETTRSGPGAFSQIILGPLLLRIRFLACIRIDVLLTGLRRA
jgi:hypothetical protein